MYKACAFETAWDVNKPAEWCSVFTDDHLKAFEYLEDLDFYYCCGPGGPMNFKLGCPILKDMFQHFK